jgi:hypothetical protein
VNILLFLLRGFENLERAKKALVDAHHSTSIVKLAAVVGSAEKRNELTLGKELISILDDLMGTADEVHVVFLQEARHYIRTKGERDTTVVLAPPSDVLIWVGPQEIAEQTAVRDISRSHDTTDLLHRVEIGAETTVHGEDLLVNNGSNRETVEAVGKCLPELNVVATLALIIETIDTVNGGTLVVATEDEEVLRILDLVRKQKADGL